RIGRSPAPASTSFAGSIPVRSRSLGTAPGLRSLPTSNPAAGRPTRGRRKGSEKMWIVRLALRRTYTFIVLAVLIAVLGVLSTQRMATDIFPEADVPVVSIVWQYTGMPPDEIESRIILINERVLTTSVNDIEHVESQSLNGLGVIRVYFQPGAKIEAAVAQTTATC